MKCRNSLAAQTTFVLATPTESIASTRYVKGETRYMKIQKWGKTEGEAKTPQKTSVSENIKFAMLPAVSAVSIAATTMVVNVDVKRRNSHMRRNIRPPRSVTALVGSALRNRPIG